MAKHHLTPVDVAAIKEQMPAACPACGGPGCDKCSHTGQAEFCQADAGAAYVQAMDLRGLARTEEEIDALRVETARVANSSNPYVHGYAAGVAAAILWLTGEIDDPPLTPIGR